MKFSAPEQKPTGNEGTAAPVFQSEGPLFDVKGDPSRGFMHYILRGHWESSTVDALVAAYEPITQAMNAAGGITHSLIDAADFEALTSEIADRFPAIVRAANPSPSRRTAIVMPQMVNRVLARPVAEMINARFFNTADAAREWLFSDEA
jgi:hypothetical protein